MNSKAAEEFRQKLIVITEKSFTAPRKPEKRQMVSFLSLLKGWKYEQKQKSLCSRYCDLTICDNYHFDSDTTENDILVRRMFILKSSEKQCYYVMDLTCSGLQPGPPQNPIQPLLGLFWKIILAFSFVVWTRYGSNSPGPPNNLSSLETSQKTILNFEKLKELC
jgi:hypothetical protein